MCEHARARVCVRTYVRMCVCMHACMQTNMVKHVSNKHCCGFYDVYTTGQSLGGLWFQSSLGLGFFFTLFVPYWLF